MVWIHGGAFVNGGSAQVTYNGSHFAEQGVVSVTINYRLGYFGFLALSQLDGPANGAFGFLDQQLALKWVHDNINNFGGDNKKITLLGESAGGCSTTFHVTTPSSWSYFQEAIIESSPCFSEARPLQDSVLLGPKFIQNNNCTNAADVLACLRAVPATHHSMNENAFSFPLPAVSTGGVFPLHPYAALSAGVIHSGPLLAGDVLNEGTAFISFYNKPMTVAIYKTLVPHLFATSFNITTKDANLAVQKYPCSDYNASDCRYAAAQLVGDFLIFCPTTKILQAKVKKNFEQSKNIEKKKKIDRMNF
jgi:para-nitrobenzyl esterase